MYILEIVIIIVEVVKDEIGTNVYPAIQMLHMEMILIIFVKLSNYFKNVYEKSWIFEHLRYEYM